MKQLLNHSGGKLQYLLQRTSELDILNNTLRGYLPAELVEHVWVTNIRQGCLILATHNATWGTHLRYLLPSLRDALRRDGILPNLTEIQYIVRPAISAAVSPTSTLPTPQLTPTTRRELTQAAQFLPAPLQQALLHLAREKTEK
ncbi:MAG: DUF721 domain-containing protein [Legionellales bacterium]|nr:DUF721 domain-containing protein [Legionellales bacterium]